MTDEQLAYENERRARQGRPPRPYNPKFLRAVTTKYGELRAAEIDFLKSIDDAIAAGVPLRDIESRTGVSRTTLSRGVTAHWHTY
jgi:hypothetical protein